MQIVTGLGSSIRARTRRFGIILSVCLLAVFGVSLARAAVPVGTVVYYTAPGVSVSYAITLGPDGALWFTNSGSNLIGRITTDA